MKYYFACGENFDGKVVEPKVPTSYHRLRSEDATTARICVSQSINGCLSAIGGWDFGDSTYIHECECDDAVQPTFEQVGDRHFSGEQWILHPIEMKLFMAITIIGMMTCHTMTYDNVVYAFNLIKERTPQASHAYPKPHEILEEKK